MPIETLNNFAVAAGPGDAITILRPPMAPMTCEEALRLAAWLVTLADGPPLGEDGEALEGTVATRFDQILEAVEAS